MNKDKSPKSLKDLDHRLRQAREQMQPPQHGKGSDGKPAPSGLGMAFRIGTELVGGLIVGVGIGLGLDAWLETSPWFLIVFFFLGSAAGMWNVYRTVRGMGLAAGYRPASGRDTAANDEE
jgi:ATP synthase protein I